MVELRVESLTKRFGGVVALDGVSLTVERAERRAIIGPNGAGKSTLFSIISGDLAPTNGSVSIAGRRTTGLSPERVARLGVARTFQTSNLFGESSVLANVMLAALQSSGHAWDVARPFARLGDCEQRARAALYVVGLADKPGVSVAALSHGEARQLEIAAALVQRPSLLLLDEPLAGLASAERERIGRLLVELPREITVLLIEHDLDFAHTFADRMTVLNNGVVLADGTPQEVRDDPAVQAVYLGTGGAAAERAPRANGAPLLEVRGLSAGYGQALVLDGVSLEVGRGEVVAILGRNGMGKTTLLTSLMGFVRPRSGAVTLAGADLTRAAPLARARAGIALVPQGRRMLSGLTVAEELRLGARPGPWDLERVRTLFPTLRERERQQSETLSGGEQQMAAIGRALLRNPALLMMDEPSEGLSPALVRSLERTIQSLRDDGETVLLAEQNVDLALAVADRVYVLEHGRVVGHESAAMLSMHRSRLERTLGL
jgi:ABC-type branched-subunit amino acid transport system ATPase component